LEAAERRRVAVLVNGKPVVPMVGEFLWVRQPGMVWNAAEGRYEPSVWGVVVRYLGEYQIHPVSGIRTGLVEEWDGHRSHLQMPLKDTRLATAAEVASWRASRASGRYCPPCRPVFAVPTAVKPTPAGPAHEG
jgi:hypothetical protein